MAGVEGNGLCHELTVRSEKAMATQKPDWQKDRLMSGEAPARLEKL